MKRAPIAFWLLAAVYALLLGLTLLTQGDPAEARFRLRDVQADVRWLEAMMFMADGEAGVDTAEVEGEIAKAAGRVVPLAEDEATPPAVREEAAALWLIFRDDGVTGDEVVALLPDKERTALSEAVTLAAQGKPVDAELRAKLRDVEMSRWLASRLSVYFDTPGELPEATSAHVAREKEVGQTYATIFLWFGTAGLRSSPGWARCSCAARSGTS